MRYLAIIRQERKAPQTRLQAARHSAEGLVVAFPGEMPCQFGGSPAIFMANSVRRIEAQRL